MDKGFFDLYFFKNIENSNDKIKEVFKKNDNSRLALFCVNQKKGRGRKGRIWKSKVGDLTCSILMEGSEKVLGGFWDGFRRIWRGFGMDFGRILSTF